MWSLKVNVESSKVEAQSRLLRYKNPLEAVASGKNAHNTLIKKLKECFDVRFPFDSNDSTMSLRLQNRSILDPRAGSGRNVPTIKTLKPSKVTLVDIN